MIPITEQPEPPTFRANVANPGHRFLTRFPHPTRKQWSKGRFWSAALPDLYTSYSGICAYSARWIPNSGNRRSNFSATVDHFIPKAKTPSLAYSWSNYRLASALLNTRKGDSLGILDPFTIEYAWFILEFPSLHIRPNPALSANQTAQVQATIDLLQLNLDETLLSDRVRWTLGFRNGFFSLDQLRRRFPFIAYELERQGLADKDILASRMRTILRTHGIP